MTSIRIFLFFAFVLIASFASAQPVINSFTPTSAEPGSTVTISGSDFANFISENAVYFGAVKGTVTLSSFNQLQVTVPIGATYAPITVTDITQGLSATSSVFFAPVFESSGVVEQSSFQETSIDLFNAAINSKIGDIDGDGLSDIVVPLYSGGGIFIFRNLGNGSYSESFYATLGLPVNVAIGEMDGDGKLDIAVANENDAISIFLNTSSIGSITLDQQPEIFGSHYDVTIADIDGDGYNDLVTSSNSFGSPPRIYRNISSFGSASFEAGVFVGSTSFNESLAVADLDGDGKLDITYINISNGVLAVRNLSTFGSISFDFEETLLGFAEARKVVCADVDADGKIDVIANGVNQDVVYVIKNESSSGSFNFLTSYSFATGAYPVSFTVADVTGDGKPEIVTTNYDVATISVLQNASSGSLDANTFLPSIEIPTDLGPWGVAVGDMDGDGKSDLVVSAQTGETVSIYKNQISLPPPAITSFTPSTGDVGTTVTITGNNFSTTAADNIVYFGAVRATVTNATETELTVTVPYSATAGPIRVTVNGLAALSTQAFVPTFTGKTDFTSADFATPQLFNVSLPQSTGVAIGDLDGDGFSDAVLTDPDLDQLLIFRRSNLTADGIVDEALFDAPYAQLILSFLDGPTTVKLVDFNNDGKLDLVANNFSFNEISVFINQSSAGLLQFGSKQNFTVGSTPTEIVTADFDKDGWVDIATSNYSSNTISVVRNLSSTGAINFAPPLHFITGAGTFDLVVSDFDGDDKTDIITANFTDSNFSLFLNQSSPGSISFTQSVMNGPGYVELVELLAGDFDGDAKPDMAASFNNDGIPVLVFLRNVSVAGTLDNASFSFSELLLDNFSYDLVAADVNGDSKLDVIESASNQSIALYKNVSSGPGIAFSKTAELTGYTLPNGLVVADMDRDTRPDLVATNQFGLTVTKNLIVPLTITSLSTTTGKPYDEVIIAGTGFSTILANNLVKINGMDAFVKSSTASELVVLVPPLAPIANASVSVTVNGTEVFSTQTFTVTEFKPFITTWLVADGNITIPTEGSGFVYNYTLYDINDLVTPIATGSNITGDHIINGLPNGTYRLSIQGLFPHLYFNNEGDKLELVDVAQWGDIRWQSMQHAFWGCANLNISAVDVPDLNLVTDMSRMFEGCSSMNANLNAWDVSSVTNMQYLFTNCTQFNQPLDSWQVDFVTNMSFMFQSAQSFNQDISAWGLRVANVTDMRYMFIDAVAFNQNIGNWQVSSVTNMKGMFIGAVTFDQDISNWPVSNVSDMSFVFKLATSFNKDISSWNVGSVTTMEEMFFGASSFNQSLGAWDISSVTNMTDMLNNSGLSTANYDATLIGWYGGNGITNPPVNITLGAAGLTYCDGVSSRNELISTKGWLIDDAGLLCPTPPQIMVFSPANGANEVPITTIQLAISFDENVFAGSGEIVITNAGTEEELQRIDVLSGFVEIDGANITINIEPLPVSSEIYVTIDAGAFRDAENTPFAGLVEFEWIFNTQIVSNHTVTSFSPTSGTVCSLVTITGTNFSETRNDNVVTIGGNSAEVLSATATELTVAVPFLSSGPIAVTISGNTITSAESFTVLPAPANGTWAQVADIPTPRYGASGGAMFGKLYVVGGNLNTGTTTVTELYDPSINSWGTLSSSGAVSRSWAGSAVVNDKLYVMGGCINGDCTGNTTNILQVLDLSSSNDWVQLSPMPVAASHMAVSVSGHLIFVSGGQTCATCDPQNIQLVYNTQSDSWLNGSGSSPYVFSQTNAVNIQGKFYAPGGFYETTGNISSNLFQFNTQNFQWQQKQSLQVARYNAGVVAKDEELYVISGSNTTSSNATLTSVEIYNPCSNTWRIGEPVPEGGQRPVVGVIDGVVYVTGLGNAGSLSSGVYALVSPPTVTGFFPSAAFADGASEVEITGTNFSSAPTANRVEIGGVEAEVVSSNTTSITVRVPRGAQTGTVKVTVNELETISAQTFTVLRPLVTTWVATGGTIAIPTEGGGYFYSVHYRNLVNFSDQGTSYNITGDHTITALQAGGTYEVEISGQFPRIYFNLEGDREKIREVSQWGDIAWTSMSNAFAGCANLQITASDTPDLSGVTDLSNIFSYCTVFNSDIASWQTITIQNMSGAFFGAYAFNGNVGGWNVSNVTDVSNLFNEAHDFNQDLSTWQVGNVTTMAGMFFNARSFNQPVSDWDVRTVTSMENMFKGATVFNQSLGTWRINNVTNMTGMLDNSGLSTANYDATLIGWATPELFNDDVVPSNVTLDAQGLTYCTSITARNTITLLNSWIINGDSEQCDTDPPTLAASSPFSPSNGSINVDPSETFVVQFNEPVVKGAGQIEIRRVTDDTVLESFSVTDSRVSIDVGDASFITINPNFNLPFITNVYVLIEAGAFEDEAGNAFAGITDKNTWRFTSIPELTITGISPMQGKEGTIVTITGTAFSDTEADNTVLFNGTPATVTSSTVTSIVTSVPTSATTGKISVSASYQTVQSVEDFVIDNASPLVAIDGFSPANASVDVSVATNFIVTFNENIQLNTQGSVVIDVEGTSTTINLASPSGQLQVTNGNQLIINPTQNLPYSAEVSIQISSNGILDMAGNFFAGISTTGWNFTTEDDMSPPTLVLDNTPATVSQGSSLLISAQFQDLQSGVSEAGIVYRKVSPVGGGADIQLELILNGQNWEASIPVTSIGEQGITYVLWARNGSNVLFQQGIGKLVTVTVQGNGLTIPYTAFGVREQNYRIVSVPLSLTSKSVTSVFADDLGVSDKKNWRLQRYSNGTTDDYTGDIKPGEGYWLIVREDKDILIDTGPGTTLAFTNSTNGFSIPVVQGWNQIGNPYNFNIDWSEVDDVNTGLGMQQLHLYNEGWDTPTSATLPAMTGAFVNVATAGNLVIPVSAGTGSRQHKVDVVQNPLDAPNWQVRFSLTQGSLKNRIGGFGMHQHAQPVEDRYDGMNLPVFFSSRLEVHHGKAAANGSYALDVVPTEQNHVWEFAVEATDKQKMITLSWDNSYFGNNSKRLVLWHKSLQVPIDMLSATSYTFNALEKDFAVVFGEEAFVKEQTQNRELLFHALVPNPTQGDVTLLVSVPENGAIVIQVNDAMGRSVWIQEQQLSAGYHELIWKRSGNSEQAGIYTVKVKQGSKMETRKLVIER